MASAAFVLIAIVLGVRAVQNFRGGHLGDAIFQGIIALLCVAWYVWRERREAKLRKKYPEYF